MKTIVAASVLATALFIATPALAAEGEMPADDNSALVGLAIGAAFIIVGTVAGAVSVTLRERAARKRPKKLYED
jgi:hypothetical protein